VAYFLTYARTDNHVIVVQFVFIIEVLMDRIKATITAETLSSLKDGAIDIFKNFMMDEGRWDDNRWNATDFVYTLGNGSKLQFKTFDTVGKAKAAGKRDGYSLSFHCGNTS